MFCMPESGHFQRMRPLISGLTRSGVAAHVFTDRKFEAEVERAGGTFIDLFSKYPIEEADDTSFPVPCRFVTFAAVYAEQICSDLEATRPSLVIHDSFAVIGRVVATRLGLPRVNVCAGHNVAPARFLAILKDDPRVTVSPMCLRAADVLRESYGVTDASPFSYVSSLSPDLNLYCEPPEFLPESDRHMFAPLAFVGSLPAAEDQARHADRAWFGTGSSGVLKVYVSFGTVVWRNYPEPAIRAMTAIAAAFARMDGVRAVISLGGTHIADEPRAALARSNVAVETYVDQWSVLREADAFVTHHGLNSTHEAIFHRVPMLSYPFFWDQPALATMCKELGLAVPLAPSLRGAIDEDDVRRAMSRVVAERASMHAALERAREWELAVIDNRPAVLRRLVDLISRGA